MRLMRTAAVLVLVGLLAAGCIARSPEIFHTPDRLDRWARVAAIPPGAEVRVWRLGSETAEPGRFVRAGDEELVLEGNAGTAAVFSVSAWPACPWCREDPTGDISETG